MSKTTAGPITTVTVTAASTPVLARNLGRREVTLVNDGANIVYLALATTAVAGQGVRLSPNGGTWTTSLWQGAISAIAPAGANNLTVTEY